MANTLAYGFVGLENLFAERVDDTNIEVIRDAIGQSVAEHNRQVSAVLSELVEPTTSYSARFRQAGSGTLQPLDEFGNPLPVQERGYFDVAWPIQGGGTAWGDNRVTRAMMTVEEVNEYTLGALRRDADWMKRHILAALLDNVSWTYEDEDKGSLTIKPLANGDTDEYVLTTGDSSTDDHYLGQASAIDDSNNPFPTIYDELNEHPGNRGGTFVSYVATNLKSDIEALSGFTEVQDPDVQTGISNDQLRNGASFDPGFGDEVLGKVDKIWIVEWPMLPDGYILTTVRGADKPALAMREYDASSLQGLFQEENSPDGNLQEHRFIRYAGFGAWNRVAAHATFIGNATYQVPSAYDAPLNV